MSLTSHASLFGVSLPARLVARLAAPVARADEALWLRGALAKMPRMLDGPAIAIVGARAALQRTQAFARRLAEQLAAQGVLIVSGGALGIDAAAHEGALAAGGRTVAVLGTGVDLVYPERHAELFARIRVNGGLLSPYPPGTEPRTWHFQARNAYIAGLADAVVVVEAGTRSGSLGTASAAQRFGRALYARPGSPGCDALLLGGRAQLALDPDELARRLLGAVDEAVTRPALEGDRRTVLSALGGTSENAETLAQRTSLSLELVLSALIDLELEGQVVRLGGGRYLARAGAHA